MNNPTNLLTRPVQAESGDLATHQLGLASQNYAAPVIDHWVLQLNGVKPHLLDDPKHLESTLEHILKELQLTKVSGHSHYFGPGVSSVMILSESHLSAHTWPELGYLHVDIVTCGTPLTKSSLETTFEEAFLPEHQQINQLVY